MLVIAITVFSQNKFEVKTTGSQYTIEQINSAFNNANFCGSFFASKRNRIELNDGSVIELLSHTEIIANGLSISQDCVLNDNATYYDASWSIGQNGILIKAFHTEDHSSEKEYQQTHPTEK